MRWLLPLTAVFLVSPAVAAPPTPVPDDEQDLVFLQAARPYRLRLHLQIEGKPFKGQWDTILDSLFRYLDADGSGTLTEKELSHAPDAAQFRQLVQNGEVEAGPPPEFKDLTDNPNAGVTPAQVRGYYLRSGAAPWQAEWVARTSATELFDNELFRRINPVDHDRISNDQLKNAAALFKLDIDGDELISLPEIVATAGYQGFMAPTNLTGPIVLFDPSDKGRSLIAARVVGRYDTKKDGKLARDEVAFPKETFDALDADRDGFLSAAELARWADQPPDLEVLARLDGPTDEGVFVLTDRAGKPHPLAAVTRFSRLGAAVIQLPTDQLEFLRVDSPAGQLQPGQRASLNEFRRLDANNDGTLDGKELFQPPFRFVPYLKLADRNSDDKLTVKEFTEFLELQSKLMRRTTTLTVVDRGRTFLDLVDADHDRQISRRELLTLAGRLAPWCDKDGSLDRGKLPNQYQIIVSHGSLRSADADPGSGSILRPDARLRGPVWFRKMDRNADGDVSRAEFLGTAAQFRKMDRDGDGLLDVGEAEAGEKK